jgi:hypothetical protein
LLLGWLNQDTAVVKTPPLKVMLIVESSPMLALITGNASRYAPVKVKHGSVALGAVKPPTVLETFTVVVVPTRAASVA